MVATKNKFGNRYIYEVANFSVDVEKEDYSVKLDLCCNGSTFYGYDGEYGYYAIEPNYWCEITSPEECDTI